MIERGRATQPTMASDVTIFDPVYIAEGVTLSHCTIGPNVSIGSGSHVEKSELRDTIVGHRSRIRHSTLAKSLIGDETVIDGVIGEVTVGDHSEVKVAS